MKCTQPGCTGHDRRRLLRRLRQSRRQPRPLRQPSGVERPAPPPRRPGVDGRTACTQPGCTGTIVDGYCDVCGNPRCWTAHAGGG